MPAHQIWSCHVTQEANFEKCLCFPNSPFNIRKSYKISGRKALYFRGYQPKSSWGVENNDPPPSPSALGLNRYWYEIKMTIFTLEKYRIRSLSSVLYILLVHHKIRKNKKLFLLHVTVTTIFFCIVGLFTQLSELSGLS